MLKFKLILLISIIFITNIQSKAQQKDQLYIKLEQILSEISDNYIANISKEKLIKETINSLFNNLDPHSVYRTKEEALKDDQLLEGNSMGLGIGYILISDTMVIVSITEGGPAQLAGLQQGDKVISINDNDVSNRHISYNEIKNYLVIDSNSDIIFTIERDNHSKTKQIIIKPSTVPNPSIICSYKPNDSTLYCKIIRFSETTITEFNNICKKDKKIKNFIIDLRNNNGGLLKSVIKLCDEFFDENHIIIKTIGEKDSTHNFFTTKNGKYFNSRIVVMINENTASASEVFSGAIQDWDRGVIIGRRSFGKGLIQKRINLFDGSQIRLSNAKYYTPSGRCIQKPYTPGNFDKYFDEINNRNFTGELVCADSIKPHNNDVFYTIIRHRKIYSLGGITPDVFIPLQNINIKNIILECISQQIFDDFAVTYIYNNKSSLKKYYNNFKLYNKEFVINDNLVAELYKSMLLNSKLKSKYSPKEIENCLYTDINKSKLIIKASIAKYLFSNNEYFILLNNEDPIFINALKIIDSPQLYEECLSGGIKTF
ncbi:MAG: S41 family peptidase [Bacteroidales bacterium]|nr:S41 family peptidase [Bacteroidales bacterium]